MKLVSSYPTNGITSTDADLSIAAIIELKYSKRCYRQDVPFTMPNCCLDIYFPLY